MTTFCPFLILMLKNESTGYDHEEELREDIRKPKL